MVIRGGRLYLERGMRGPSGGVAPPCSAYCASWCRRWPCLWVWPRGSATLFRILQLVYIEFQVGVSRWRALDEQSAESEDNLSMVRLAETLGD